MKMKNRKGFTLIELLAVITILGILMIVAIPAVSRTIENSRRNTFLSTAKEYANSVKTKYAADEIKCGSDNSSATILATNNVFIVRITTKAPATSGNNSGATFTKAYNNAKELINQGGVSSWGNGDIYGYVAGLVTEEVGNDNNKRQVVKYYINLVDAAGHGISWSSTETDKLERINVLPSSAALGITSGSEKNMDKLMATASPTFDITGLVAVPATATLTKVECSIQ